MTRIILVAGSLDPANSYEYHNFLKPLENLGYEVIQFDFLKSIKSVGRIGMNKELLDLVQIEQPKLVFFFSHTDQFIPETIDEINRHAITLGYLFDDMWRIEYSRFWADHFSFITTSDINGLSKFKDAGITNVIYSPFACNTSVFCKVNKPKIYDVSFVGQYHPYREWHINHLKKAGINVNVWGAGWPSGMINTEDMVNIFNQSRINLNMSNCVLWDLRYIITLSRPIKSTLRVWRQLVQAIAQKDMKTVEQVKGRHFEINACGGFQLTYYVEGLERLYRIGDEIALFVSREDLLEKILYYLKHEDEREKIAKLGLERTIKEHKMERRLTDIFNSIGL